jgi:hypothetical protein
MDSRDDYTYGWTQKGQRFYALKLGRCQGRVNLIASDCNRQLMAPFTIEGKIASTRVNHPRLCESV